MEESKEKNFALFINSFYEYYDKKVSDAALDIYWEGLKEFSLDELKSALQTHIKRKESGKFLPKVCDFEDIIRPKVAW